MGVGVWEQGHSSESWASQLGTWLCGGAQAISGRTGSRTKDGISAPLPSVFPRSTETAPWAQNYIWELMTLIHLAPSSFTWALSFLCHSLLHLSLMFTVHLLCAQHRACSRAAEGAPGPIGAGEDLRAGAGSTPLCVRGAWAEGDRGPIHSSLSPQQRTPSLC